jgi:hypothetical protein
MVDVGWGSSFENYRKLMQESQKIEAKLKKSCDRPPV